MRKLIKNSFHTPRKRFSFLPNLKQNGTGRVLWIVAALAIISFGVASYDHWVIREPAPAAGGSYTEGVVGTPQFLNPLLVGNNEAERDTMPLIFAGLTTHDSEGNITGNLAESIEEENRGRVYTFTLHEGLRWSDGEPLTSDDVVFTIERLQDPQYQLPGGVNWQGVKVEKIDERNVRFTLTLPFVLFLENTTVGIIPKHKWESVSPEEFSKSELNMSPVSSGPYRVKRTQQDGNGNILSLELSRNSFYHQPAYLSRINIHFYPTEETLMTDWRRGEIDGLSLFTPSAKKDVSGRGGSLYAIKIPRYFAVFFNEEVNDLFEDRRVRRALAYFTPRERIIEEVFLGEAVAQEGPIPPWHLPPSASYFRYEFSRESAEAALSAAGWELNNEGVREKQFRGESSPRQLEFTLTTADIPELTRVTSILKEAWETLGARVNIDIVPFASIQQQTIRPRNYEALLFGEALGITPDPYSFWHSSQVEDPGLNLSLYENREIDALLESARQTIDEEERQVLLQEIETIITRDVPAIFLYSPHYLYVLPRQIKGFEKQLIGTPGQRFEGVNQWYIKTIRKRPNHD